MGEKFFTVSFDDGTGQDVRLISLMEKYGIKGTFNLSSGLFGKKSYIRRVGDMAKSASQIDCAHPEEYVDHFILSKPDALRLYSHPNVEVASHGTHHLVQTDFTSEQAHEEIERDIQALSELFGCRVTGHAFPKGSYNENVLSVLRNSGAVYARKVSSNQPPEDFSVIKDGLLVTPTCRHNAPFAKELLQKFLDTPAMDGDIAFHMWGHSYELDYGTDISSYERIEELFAMVAGAKDIVCVTNGELYRRF